jgi:hypothetical protein
VCVCVCVCACAHSCHPSRLSVFIHLFWCFIISAQYVIGARCGAVGWDTVLQTRRSRVGFPMVSLEFFIDIILPAALWPQGRLNLYQKKWVPGISWGVKAASAQGWQPYHLHVPIVLKSGSLNFLEPLGPVQACNRIALPLQYVISF